MGLTSSSTGIGAQREELFIRKRAPEDKIIALAGNPNVGKSTLFNALTGMKQHTGNWPGKTVSNAQGYCKTEKSSYVFVDIPGTYSLLSHSPEETVARNFICFGEPYAVVIVCDATCLERNLNLVLQTLEAAKNAVVCVNLLDEAEKKGISVDLGLLSRRLGVPVVGTVARNKKSLKPLLNALDSLPEQAGTHSFKIMYSEFAEQAIAMLEPVLAEATDGRLNTRWLAVRLLEGNSSWLDEINKFLRFDISKSRPVAEALQGANEFLASRGITNEILCDEIVRSAVISAEIAANGVVGLKSGGYSKTDKRFDKIFTSRLLGYPIMLLGLCLIFWLTLVGANYISELLSALFLSTEQLLSRFLDFAGCPSALEALLVEGAFRVPAWVISVMLPPMAIFFPLFTLLEDSGYLPRVAYNLDKPFKRCRGCGKQALTVCMGFGCNAAGVVGSRIIASPRERLLAVITNSMVPCNGRFPAITAIISMFFICGTSPYSALGSAVLLTAVILFGVTMTLLSTRLLSATILKGVPSSYILEMPSYRRPKIGTVIIRSALDRTAFVLGRAVAVAVPAGIIIWLLANITVNGATLLNISSNFLDPFARLMGLDGVILMAFILGFPANEIVIPLILMCYLQNGALAETSSLVEIKSVLVANGWEIGTAVCTVIFSLLHWPCSTTVLTIKKETGSAGWTWLAVLLPTALGCALCMLVNLIF